MTYKPEVVIGIDPGTRTGIAFCLPVGVREGKWRSGWNLCGLEFFEAIDVVQEIASQYAIALVIEDARKLPQYARTRSKADSAAVTFRKGRNAGVTDRDTTLWEAFARRRGLPYALTSPARKLEQAVVFRETGIVSNQHERDAYRIASAYASNQIWVMPKSSK